MKYQTQAHFLRRTTTRKYPPRSVISTRDITVQEQWQQATAAEAPLSPRQLAAGWVQHPQTDLYQAWLSTNGLDVACISAHRSIIQAESDVRAIKLLITSGDLYDDEKAASLFVQLKHESDEEPRQLPDDLVRQICRAIQCQLLDRPRPATPPAGQITPRRSRRADHE